MPFTKIFLKTFLFLVLWLSACSSMKWIFLSGGLDMQWESAGFTYEEAKEWNDFLQFIPVSNYYQGTQVREDQSRRIAYAKTCKSYGFSRNEANEWIQSGITDVNAVVQLKRAGLAPEEVKGWNGFTTDWIIAMKKLNCTVSEAKQWRELKDYLSIEGWPVVDQRNTEDNKISVIAEWKSFGFSPEELKKFKDNGFERYMAAAWKEAGFSFEEALKWGPGIHPKDVNKWKKIGFTPTKAREWNASRLNLSEIDKWKKKGFGLNEIREWYQFFEPEEAMQWKKAGFTVAEAKEYQALGVDGTLKVKTQCPRGFDSLYSLLLTNPYDVEGKCFEFAGNTMQVLSRTTGLFTQSGQVFYIDFGNQAIPNIGFQGIVKGVGVYEYITRLGVLKKIPRLKKVLITG